MNYVDFFVLMEFLLLLSIPGLIVFGIIYFKNKNKNKSNTNSNQNQTSEQGLQIQSQPIETKPTNQEIIFPYYLSSTLLSPKEQSFYKSIKPITDELGLIIFTKMRIIDIVQVSKNHPEYMKWFNYIKAKHIDFILCDKEFKVYKLIEVDDYTHQFQKRKERDEFVDKIFKQLNVELLRYYKWTSDQLKNDITPKPIQTISTAQILDINKEEEKAPGKVETGIRDNE